MELSVTYHGENIGTLCMEQQGLYYLVTVNCSIQLTEPMRVFAINGFSSTSVGVLSKDGTLSKRISAHTAQPLPQRAVLGNAENGYYPWSGTVDGEEISDAFLRCDETQTVLALPVSDGGEVPLIAYAAQMQPVTVCGRQCLTLPLLDGKPLQLPQEETIQEQAVAAEAAPENVPEEETLPEEEEPI